MDQTERRTKGNTIRILSLAGLAAVIFLSMFAAQRGWISGLVYHILIFAALAAFWVVMDIVSPRLTHSFDDRTPEQISAYKKYALLELAGYAGLGYFAIALNGSNGIYGALVFALTMMFKRRFLDQFLGEEEKSENEEELPEEERNALPESGERDGTENPDPDASEQKKDTDLRADTDRQEDTVPRADTDSKEDAGGDGSFGMDRAEKLSIADLLRDSQKTAVSEADPADAAAQTAADED